jgi:hypothetical protein
MLGFDFRQTQGCIPTAVAQARDRNSIAKDAVWPTCQEPRQVALAHRERQAAEILAIQRQAVDSIELHLTVVPARMQSVEIGYPVSTQHNGLAVDYEMPRAVGSDGAPVPPADRRARPSLIALDPIRARTSSRQTPARSAAEGLRRCTCAPSRTLAKVRYFAQARPPQG